MSLLTWCQLMCIKTYNNQTAPSTLPKCHNQKYTTQYKTSQIEMTCKWTYHRHRFTNRMLSQIFIINDNLNLKRTTQINKIINFFWFVKQGLGPTKLISPRSTFQSCGNSSNLDRLRKWPIGVTAWGSARRVATERVSRFIVRNLIRVNGRWFWPTRTWKKIAEPFSTNAMIKTTTERGMNKTTLMKAISYRIVMLIANRNSMSELNRCRHSMAHPTIDT